jgi:methionyl-tRNA synthetase
VNRLNADLANDLGNLVSRSLTMVHKYFDGVLPDAGPLGEEDEALRNSAVELVEIYRRHMNKMAFHKALMAVWEVISDVNKYIDVMAPWVLAKSDPERLKTVICHIYETLRIIAGLVWPFIPASAEKIQEQLGLKWQGENCSLEDLKKWGLEKPVHPIRKAPGLFPRIDVKKKEKQAPAAARKEKPKKAKTDGGEPQGLVSFKDFQKLDLRIGVIVAVEEIPGSKKLFKLTVDMGEKRTVVAGIKGHYEKEDLPGMQVLLLANLEPAKLMGIESQGMLLAAGDKDGLHLMRPDSETTPGAKVK